MENAGLYSSANGMQKKDAKEILAEFRDKFKWSEGARILDIGCGSGEVTTEIILPLLPKQFRELVGLDISLEMIQHARNLHPHPKVSFIQFDIALESDHFLQQFDKTVRASRNDNLNLEEFDDEPRDIKILLNNREITQGRFDCKKTGYDVIVSFYCLHWIPNQRLAIKNIYRLINPGGEALLVFLAKSPIFTLYRVLSKLALWKDYMQDVDSFIPLYQDAENPLEKFTEILKSSGFKIIVSDCREKNYVFENITTLRNAIKAVNPFLPRIPKHLQEKFMDECLQQTKIHKLTEFKNNRYRVNYKLIVAHIRKPTINP